MKLIIDLDCLAPPLTGIGHYTRELTQRLLAREEMESIVAMYHGRWIKRHEIETLLQAQNSPEHASPVDLLGRLKPWVRQLPGARWAWQNTKARRFRSLSARHPDHVYWEPNFLLKPTHCPGAVTIYDLSPLELPELHPASRVAMLQHSLQRSVKQAEMIITISHFTARALQVHLGVSASRVRLVPPAADESFRPLPGFETKAIKNKYRLPEQFILSVGTLEPRKNLSRLLSAYERLPDSLRHAWPLVCVGARGWNDTALSADISRLETRGELIRLGYVPQQDLPSLTAAAGLIAYLSIYEGFGMPVVEGLACGVPVLTSEGTAMQEVAQDCAFYTDPFNIEAISHSLERALTDTQAREHLVKEGPLKARRYRWEDSAEVLATTLASLSRN